MPQRVGNGDALGFSGGGHRNGRSTHCCTIPDLRPVVRPVGTALERLPRSGGCLSMHCLLPRTRSEWYFRVNCCDSGSSTWGTCWGVAVREPSVPAFGCLPLTSIPGPAEDVKHVVSDTTGACPISRLYFASSSSSLRCTHTFVVRREPCRVY